MNLTTRNHMLRELDHRLAVFETDARDLARNLERELARTHDLARDLDPARDLHRDLNREFHFARTRVRDLDLDLDLDRHLDRHLDRVGDLVRARARARALVFGLDRARGNAVNWALNLGDREPYLALASARDRAQALAKAVADVRARVQETLLTTDTSVDVSNSRHEAAPERLALRVLQCTLQALPVVDRARYSEELEAELTELAADGASRRAQLAYALRLAERMWALRRALRAAAPGRERVR